MRKIHVLLAISPFFLMTAQAEETQMTDPKTIEQQLAFTCVHEKAKLPPLNPEADQLYRYARWLAQNQRVLKYRSQDKPEDYLPIARYYRIAWAHGHYKANVELVNMLSKESIADPNLASTLLKLADGLIEMGVPGGYYDMGRYIQRGLGVKRDPDLANRFYRKAADLGNPEAQFFIGEKLINLSIDYPVPYAIGNQMQRCAADQGHAEAALSYAMYLQMKEQYPEALKYYQIAVKGGLSVAANILRKAFLAPEKTPTASYLALAKDEERSRRYEIIGFQTLAERDYLKPTVPELDDIVPLPPAKLPKWNGSTKWLDDFKAGKPPVPQPDEAVVARLAAEKGLDPATGLLLADAHKRKLSSLTPPSAAALALGAMCKTGDACPESGVWQVQWSSSTVEYTEREAAAPDAYPQDFYNFSKGDVFPNMPFRLQWSDWRIDTLPVKWRLAAYPFVEKAPPEPEAPEPRRKPVRLHISTTCKTGEVCGQKGIWQALWPSGTVEHTSRKAVKLAQVPVDFPQDFYTFEAGDVFPNMPLTYERSTWAIHKTPITWQLVAYQPNETYKHSTVYVEVDEPENTQPPKHPMQGRRFTSGDVCPCDADYRTFPYAEHEEVLESKRHIKKGEVFPEMMVRHTKPREVIIKTGWFSKKTEQDVVVK